MLSSRDEASDSVVNNSVIDVTEVKVRLQALKAQELAQFNHSDINHLIAERSRFYDQLLQQLWHQFGLDQQPLALVAVGGYGREEMFPLSDLDILILSETALDTLQQDNISALIQFLWDCHFDVGHSVRTLDQCIAEGQADISIATNLLESRFLDGHQTLFRQLQSAVKSAEFWSIEAFFAAKMQEKAERYQRYNNTGYNLEPDIKYSPGGLRDLHLLYWIALRHLGVKNLQEILDSGFIYPEEHRTLNRAQQFLFKLRFALHLVIKRYDNRLLFDRQVKVSEMLGYQGAGNRAVEEMMKHFFRASHDIMQLTELLLQHYQEHFIQTCDSGEAQSLDAHFELKNQAIRLRNPDCFLQQPDTILDLFFHLTQQPQALIHSTTLRRLRLALVVQDSNKKGQYLIDIPSARQKFVHLLAQPQAIARAIVPMHQHGVLNAYCEEWNNISGLMQFDLFHAYTVDEHTVRVLLKLESFLEPQNAEQHPLCVELFPNLANRTLIYLTALFHDIAKGRGGDHAELGAIDVYDFAQKHGFDEQDAEMTAWLVLNHLKMSVTAQRRDIYDPQVVLAFANSVKYQIRLDYLTCLTVADISATNSTLWNSWKRSLIKTLYQFTKQQLEQGTDYLLDISDEILQHRLRALALLQPLLQDERLKLRTVNDFWQRCPQDYFLRNNPQQLAWHVELICQSNEQAIVKSSNRFSQGGTELFVYCPDQPHLFNKVVRAIEAKNLSIHDAQILTSNDGYALDSFIISETSGVLAKFDRRRSIEQSVKTALLSEYKPALNIRINNKLQHFHVPTEVRFIDSKRRDQTELEIFVLDKPGLLVSISNVFSEQGLNLLNAKITTTGERAEDFFILANSQNRALDDSEKLRLQQALLTALD
ncbi:bifunctional uridylyltransferase/uridylyl-removing protein GlnD [Testudinibacter sp. TR-2022]|uniref:bifunctional uridylyltransferase/uridylyl-removing protein GlnD n=1 Tax=Testudinibacter sp. TR-2022 TaxID=2585029 RepID=UPI001119311E|nr:bifunctional uridylyltransferase/uridylyl-removing protein GlnD [Testudinibacter sp. TR-2022]TNH04391.1 bifunctional uridylyltransferase/uridylyl-removing protein GlnD [Pasteurellaceae bacterium Phil31]TNH06177.1 bifunctional uridylyltransferase/uridylyl-removing protein GlnD [Testudinibacter sp. TR-2022]TNH07101.1 bifunctional uridylyltransferase/uridylyl-removing protein GlnD [Testudinibacter sp. TR-2022]TNH12199.1 bifunctional uridylyltransferase/uridylyl-removing protein GlnD [Testudinib